MGEAVVGGMLLMWLICGAYIGMMLPVRRRGMSILLCALIWPIILVDVDWKTKNGRCR